MYDVSDDWVPIYDKSSLGGYYLAIGDLLPEETPIDYVTVVGAAHLLPQFRDVWKPVQMLWARWADDGTDN
eukprot:SAG11_NODE_988_length_6275_cov_10.173413_4_plen_71_part_00